MLNRIFKTKFDPATGLSYAISELGKSHKSKAISLSALGAVLVCSLSFSSSSLASCPTPTADSAVVQVGETCNYDGNSFKDSGNTTAVIDIKTGGSATFSAQDVSLQKTEGNPSNGSYAVISLGKETNATLSNKAIFEGNLAIISSNTKASRDIIVGAGSELHIKGNVTIERKATDGSVFVINGDENSWKDPKRTDTKMLVDGEVTVNGDPNSTATFLRMGNGEIVFAKDVRINMMQGAILPDTGSTGKLTFNGPVTVDNKFTFVNIARESNPEITFNKSLTVTQNTGYPIFLMKGGIVNLNADTTLTAEPTSKAIAEMYNAATLNNNAQITINSNKATMFIKARPDATKAPAIFNNTVNGVINNAKHIAINDGDGTLQINNEGSLTSTELELFKNTREEIRGGNPVAVTRPAGDPIGTIEINNTGTLTGFITSGDTDTISLTNDTNGVWNNTKDSSLDNLVNKGTINFIAPADKSHLTISTDKYTGGGTLVMNTIWTDSDNSTSDKLKIKTIEGDAVTTVKVVGEKFDAITQQPKEQSTVNVIEVENDHNGNLFVGTAKTNSPKEAQLTRVGNNYVWTLEAIIDPPELEPEPEPQPPVETPENPPVNNQPPVVDNQPKPNPAEPSNPKPQKPKPKTVAIISQPVVGYVQMPFINGQMAMAQMGKLHERVGEQRHLAWKNGVPANQLWGRISHDYSMLQGLNRFGANVKSGFVQFGRDIHFKLNEDNSQQHTGLTFTYGWANSKFYDKYRAKNGRVVADKYTGSAKTDMFSVGGYHTYYSPTGAYVDLVGQVSWLQNRYNSDNTQVKQSGYGFGASVEVGKPFALLNPQVTLEPQAQLTYQSIWLNGFNDGDRNVRKSRQDSLVGRLGVRVNWSQTLEQNSPQIYFTANLMQTLAGKGSAITVGNEKVEERYGDLVGELGIGAQYPIKPNLSLYADFRHVISLKGENRVHRDSDLFRKSYNGRIGVRYSW